METHLGVTQFAFQGTPINSCLAVVGTGSACQWAEGRGNFVNLTRNADGSISKGDVVRDARTDPLVQTDVSFVHQIPFQERYRLMFEANIQNIFNQRAATAVREQVLAANLVSPTRASRFPGDPAVDWGKVMNGYNYIDALNGTGSFATVQNPLTLSRQYGMPYLFQAARAIGWHCVSLSSSSQSPFGGRETGPFFCAWISLQATISHTNSGRFHTEQRSRTPTGSKRRPGARSRTR